MSNNKLIFDVFCDSVTKIAKISCVESVGVIATFTDGYSEFKKAHKTTAENFEKTISALDDIFLAGNIEKDLELVRTTMAMLEAEPFLFYLVYEVDTVSEKLNKKAVKRWITSICSTMY
jgi:hypothetical protein